MACIPESGILVEAEAFDEFGGWVMDSQYDAEMGSPYLLAHGNGRPVADATTMISIPHTGEYHVWVRAKDWVPAYHPGRFTLAINGTTICTEFGANGQDWNWQFGGRVKLSAGRTKLTLHDLTGFCGRCDAIFFGADDTPPPSGAGGVARAWRRRLRGLPDEPADTLFFDAVVVGGGIPGSTAALLAARLGLRVALIHNRPVLGGNGSVEAGLRPRGVIGPFVEEIVQRKPDGDLCAKQLLDAEPNATVFLEYTVFQAITTDGSSIRSIDARDACSGREIRISAPVFIDCSGKCVLGLLSGAETMSGQESKAEFGESLAPTTRKSEHHGNTLFFRTKMGDKPVHFPSVPWAIEVAKDFSNLSGQLVKPGIDNGEGPVVIPPGHVPDLATPRRMKLPLTHFNEYGQNLDMYTNGERIRDHLLRALYGTFSNVKTMDPEKYENLDFDWVAYVPATGEYWRYKGDFILSETDIREHKHFDDAVVQNGSAFCLHHPGHETYDFRLKYWDWDERDGNDYDIPFRCLYSTNITNLMMAGKHISTTHVAMSSTKFMGNGAQHAIATAAAAVLCIKYNTTPRGIYEKYLIELRSITESITGAKSHAKL